MRIRGWLQSLTLALVSLGAVHFLPARITIAVPNAEQPSDAFFSASPAPGGLIAVHWNDRAVRQNTQPGQRLTLRNFPVTAELAVDLEIEPFSVTSAHTQFVLGRQGHADQRINFDPSRILLFRGRVLEYPASHVFLAFSDNQTTGYVDLGAGAGRFGISSRGADRRPLGANRLSIFPAVAGAGSQPDVPLCGMPAGAVDPPQPVAQPRSPTAADLPPATLRHLELAVETDFEFFQLFGDANEAATYLVELYAQVSDIYWRDLGVRVELVYARLWDNPDDLFNVVDPSPLPEFRAYWNMNMTDVQRDVAQLLSGRRDYPFGGQAYLSALCGTAAYSVVGYAMGSFPDPTQPDPFHYDIEVTAHELGHNCGTFHTHDYGIDSCASPTGTPQRGTIMSYCSQTWSGSNSNIDLYFHTQIRDIIWDYLPNAQCITIDCNQNGTADDADVLIGTSSDANSNFVPDECEDCNFNAVLDTVEIINGASLDLNSNGLPDECEADCNGNDVPDDMDLLLSGATDDYGNRVLDECEADCNSNGTSDYTEIQLNMPLDVDRDAVLDSCQDCNSDGEPDIGELGGAHNLWVASGQASQPIRQFYSSTGVQMSSSTGGSGSLVNQAQDLMVTPDLRILVSSAGNDRVLRYDLAGAYQGVFVAQGAGGLDYPTGLLMTPSGMLLVASRNTDQVLAYSGQTGASLGVFVQQGAGGLDAPFGLTLTPWGNLLVTSASNEVIEYDGTSGSFLQVLVSAANNGGLDQPRGLTYKPDGNLLVTSFGTNETLEFEGQTGEPLGKWAQVGTASVLTQDSPWGIRVGPNGNVFVVRTGTAIGLGTGEGDHHDHADVVHGDGRELHLTNAQIYEFDARNGNFIRTQIGGNDHDLVFPSGFDFVPGWDIDCNLNLLPDSCDLASGFSEDRDASGVPDECEVDCNSNGVYDRRDIIPRGSSRDCNANHVPDECDLASGAGADFNGNDLLDECECFTDLDANGVVNAADLAFLLGAWGPNPEHPADFNHNGIVNAADLAHLLGAWGACP